LEWKPKKRDHETVCAQFRASVFARPNIFLRPSPSADGNRVLAPNVRSNVLKRRRGKSGADQTTRSYPLYLERSAISTAFIDRSAKQTLKRRPSVGTIEKIAIFVQQNRPERRALFFRQKFRDRQKRSTQASASERSNKSVPLFNFNLLRAIRKKKFSLFKDFSGKFPLPQRFLQL
jgi:hypothetical protein